MIDYLISFIKKNHARYVLGTLSILSRTYSTGELMADNCDYFFSEIIESKPTIDQIANHLKGLRKYQDIGPHPITIIIFMDGYGSLAIMSNNGTRLTTSKVKYDNN